VIRLDENERVVDVSLVAEREEEGGGGASMPPQSMPPAEPESAPDDGESSPSE
jgi:hypothetical protein